MRETRETPLVTGPGRMLFAVLLVLAVTVGPSLGADDVEQNSARVSGDRPDGAGPWSSERMAMHHLAQLLELMPDMSGEDQETDDTATGRFLYPRPRKSGGTRPKYDPGLKWMGLGKRGAAPIGHELFTDLRRFFNTARRDLLETPSSATRVASISAPKEVAQALSLGQHSAGSEDALRFETRSKDDGAARKSNYNPSLLWTGLGRR